MEFNHLLTNLELRDVFSFGSLIISATSLFISAYWNSLRGAKLIGVPPRFAVYLHVVGGQDYLIVPVTIINTGVQTGVLDYFYLKMFDSSKKEDTTIFACISDGDNVENFCTSIQLNSGQNNVVFNLPSLKDLPPPFVLKPGESRTKYLAFISPYDWKISLSINSFTVYGHFGGKKKPQKMIEQKFKFQGLPSVTSYAYVFNSEPKEILVLSKFLESRN